MISLGRKKIKRLPDYTQGRILPQMVAFAVPHMITSALQILYSTVDMSIIGKAISGTAFSAVSVSSQIMNLLTTIFIGFATGGQVYMAQLIGAKIHERVPKVIGTVFTVMIALSAVLCIGTIVFYRLIFSVMNTPSEAIPMAYVYLVICSFGLFFISAYNCFSGILRAFGDVRTPMIAILIASIVNIILDLILIVGLRFGVYGAAIATVTGQFISVLILIVSILKREEYFHFKFEKRYLKPDPGIVKPVARLAVPFAFEFVVFNISMLFISSQVNAYGIYATETFGIGLKVEEIGNKICIGITSAASVMVSHNIANGNIRRTRYVVHAAWFCGAFIYAIYAFVCICFPEELFSLFVNDAEVIAMAPAFISAVKWGFPAMASMRGTNGLMQGVGNARLSLIIAVIDGIAVRIPLSIILGRSFGLWGFFLAYALAAYTNAGLGLVYYLSGKWTKRKLVVER